MKYVLCWWVLFLQICLGCAAADDAQDFSEELPAVDTREDALTFSLQRGWEGTGGAGFKFQQLEFMSDLVDRSKFPLAPPGAKHFYGRGIPPTGPIVDLFGYYLEGATTVTVGRIGTGLTVNQARFLCADSLCSAPAVYTASYVSGTSTLTLTKSTDRTTLRPLNLTINGSNAGIVTPANPNRIEEFSAQELKRHLELVFNVSDIPVFTEDMLLEPDRTRSLIYVGTTNMAHWTGMNHFNFPQEGYKIRTAGKYLVLNGGQSSPAVTGGTTHWINAGNNTNAIQFSNASSPTRYEIPAQHNLFSASGQTPGGTVELWLKDSATGNCGTAANPCGSSVLMRLVPGYALTSGLAITAFEEGDGTWLAMAVSNSIGGAVEAPGVKVLRDGAVHHITFSFQPCDSSICASTYLDQQVIAEDVPIPGTSMATLALNRNVPQQLVLNAENVEWSATLHGLRIAARPSTYGDHDARRTPSALSQSQGDQFVLDFARRGVFPKEKIYNRFATGLLPSRWGQRGALHASYELLDRFFGVRWYMPTNIGLAYTTRSSVTIPPQALSLVTPLRYRHTLDPNYLTSPALVTADSLGEAFEPEAKNLWALRMRLGGDDIEYNHAFYNFKNNQAAAHPSWFAGTGQPCFGNTEFTAQVATYAHDYAVSADDQSYLATGNAGRDMRMVKNGSFSLTPLDGDVLPRVLGNGEFIASCNYQSALQRGLIRTGYAPEQFFEGTASDYVFDFYNRVAQTLTPGEGRDPFVTGLSYADYAFPPTFPIHAKVKPVVNFFLQDWGTGSIQDTGRAQLTAWRDKMGAAGYYGWSYLIDTSNELVTPPWFEYRRISAAANEALGLGLKGLVFEHSHSWSIAPLSLFTDPFIAQFITDFRAYRDWAGNATHWNAWPNSLSYLFAAGPNMFFECGTPNAFPNQAYYCGTYNNGSIFDRLRPLLRTATEGRGQPAAQLESYLLMRRMGDSNFNANAAIAEFFSLYYGPAAAAMSAVYERMAQMPAAYTITGCSAPGTPAYDRNKCMWPARLPESQVLLLGSSMDQARGMLPSMSAVQAKRFRAFDRNVWCVIARAYYDFYPNGPGARSADPLHARQACVEDLSLKTYLAGPYRYVAE